MLVNTENRVVDYKKYFFFLCVICFLNFCLVFPVSGQSNGYLKYYEYSQKLIKQKKYVNADMVLSQGLKKFPRSERLLLARATNRANNLGNIQEAIKDYSRLLKLDPRNFKIFFRRGEWFYKIGQYGYALRDFNRTLSLKPGYGKVYLERAKVYAKFGNSEKAKKDLETLVKLRPGYKRAADDLYMKIIQGKRDF